MAGRRLSRLLPSLVVFAVLLAAWQAAGTLFGVREYLLPGPLAVARALASFAVPWHRHLWVTTLEIVGGFVLAGAAGVALGIAVAWPLAARALLPFLVFVTTPRWASRRWTRSCSIWVVSSARRPGKCS